MKLAHFALACLLAVFLSLALISSAQNVTNRDLAEAKPSVQPPTTDGQTSDQPSITSKPSAGQTVQPPPSVDQPASPTEGQNKEKDKDKTGQTSGTSSGAGTPSGTSNDRLFFALPNFLTVQNSANIPPLTAGEKFKVVARGSFDPVQIVWYGALSGISQAEDSEPGYGQGAEGYGKRYGAYAADGTIENFFVGAILPSVLHQDPRYFQSGQGSFFHRTEYAVSRIFVTRSDAGHHEFNFSEIFGAAIASAISTYSYHPRSDRTVDNTASVWGSQIGYDTITLVVKEFWPDIRRKLKKQPH